MMTVKSLVGSAAALALMAILGGDLAPAGNPARAAASPAARTTQVRDGLALRPITARMRPQAGSTASGAQVQLAALNAAVLAPGWQSPAAGAAGEVQIDVIVAYTRKAARNYADINRDLIAPAIEGGNRSFRLSGIGHVRLRLVHAYQTGYAESGDHFDHVWRFADKGDGYMDGIHELREKHRADVAVLIVDDASGCGQATRVGAEADEAFAVVHHACASANYTLAHEIGHLIGASHDRGYVQGNEWRDIMSYKAACDGCPRLPLWSNPRLLIEGRPAGTAARDNARIIAEQAPRVAAFR